MWKVNMDFIDRIKQSWETLVKPYPISTKPEPNTFRKAARPVNQAPRYSVEAPPNLQGIIEDIGPLAPYSIVIGGCDDRSHLFMDLSDPAPGSLLIVGDDRSGRSRLLTSMLSSSAVLTSPRRVRYALIAPDLTGLDYLIQRPHCYKAHATDTGDAIDMIYELAEIADYRRNNQVTGSVIILAVDDLACLLSTMDDEMVEQLRWLVTVGPGVQIWTIATLNSEDVSSIEPEFLNQFGTRLIGSVGKAEVVDYLCGSEEPKPEEVIAGAQFCVLFNEDWVMFWIPAVEEVVS
jgi:hypothetical protein